MKAKLLRDAGDIAKGAAVEIKSSAGSNDARSDKDLGGRSTTPGPVYEVADSEGHTETVDTRRPSETSLVDTAPNVRRKSVPGKGASSVHLPSGRWGRGWR